MLGFTIEEGQQPYPVFSPPTHFPLSITAMGNSSLVSKTQKERRLEAKNIIRKYLPTGNALGRVTVSGLWGGGGEDCGKGKHIGKQLHTSACSHVHIHTLFGQKMGQLVHGKLVNGDLLGAADSVRTPLVSQSVLFRVENKKNLVV